MQALRRCRPGLNFSIYQAAACPGFSAEGAVSLSGAEIGGQLRCEYGQFKNAAGVALNAKKSGGG